MKKIFSLLVTAVVVTSCVDSKVKLKTEDDKTFYAMGYMLGGNLQRLNLTDQELKALYKGIAAASSGTKSEVEMATYQPKIQQMFQERMLQASKKNKDDGSKYITDYLAKNKDAKKTESGLVYHSLKEGTGKTPSATDTVEVHYHGTLINGEVFDSSVDRDKKISFPLNRVIKGWTEGLQLMKEGGKMRFVIPADLAYGEQGAPPKIPGGATLVFEVELFKVMDSAEQNMPEGHSKGDGHKH